ncbi:hypothetical protein CI238_00385, partial [Colletotrichum incanum]
KIRGPLHVPYDFLSCLSWGHLAERWEHQTPLYPSLLLFATPLFAPLPGPITPLYVCFCGRNERLRPRDIHPHFPQIHHTRTVALNQVITSKLNAVSPVWTTKQQKENGQTSHLACHRMPALATWDHQWTTMGSSASTTICPFLCHLKHIELRERTLTSGRTKAKSRTRVTEDQHTFDRNALPSTGRATLFSDSGPRLPWLSLQLSGLWLARRGTSNFPFPSSD